MQFAQNLTFFFSLLGLSVPALGVIKPNPSRTFYTSAFVKDRIKPGQVTLLKIVSAKPVDLAKTAIRLGDDNLRFFNHPAFSKDVAFAFVPVAIDAKPGLAKVNFKWSAETSAQDIDLHISPGQYPSEKIKVGKERVKLSKRDQMRALAERKETVAIYASPNPRLLWTKPFRSPLDSKITSPYGTQRLFNGALQSFHTGVDLRALVGTTIRSTNAGIVRLAKNLFYSGNAVVIDHGMGVFSNYAHLKKTHVRVGQRVERGEPLGLSGATGRVSGPHLHWGVKVGKAQVDPMQFRDVTQVAFSR